LVTIGAVLVILYAAAATWLIDADEMPVMPMQPQPQPEPPMNNL
jgi:hypothetical protein